MRSLLSQAAAEYGRTRRTAASNATGIIEATRQAQPQIAGAFDQALGSVQAQRAALGVGAGDPQAAAYERRVGEQKALALTDLVQQAVRAEQGRVYSGQVARDEYLGKKSQITGELLDFAQKQGLTAQSIYGKLKDERLQRGVTRRGQDVTARGQSLSSRDRQASLTEQQRHNRASEANAQRRAAAGGSRTVSGVKLASPEVHARTKDSIEQALAQVKDLRQDTPRRSDIIALLIKGVPASKLPDGTAIPAIPKLPADVVRAAMNIEFDGNLSRGDVRRLHARGLRLRTLGYPVRKPRAQPSGTLATLAGGRTSVGSRAPVPLGR
ncbi:MAG TPA: hypothetical protein VMY78_16635 [Solirubrobacteraceae bacterium]|nr:hypothetical protein [Solirubrobacteraceae bacterium]